MPSWLDVSVGHECGANAEPPRLESARVCVKLGGIYKLKRGGGDGDLEVDDE